MADATRDGMSKADMLLGGPGLDGYAYQADVYCVPCGQSIINDGPDWLDGLDARNSEVTPQPIFFGESDTAEHCAHCDEYLYGTTTHGASIRPTRAIR